MVTIQRPAGPPDCNRFFTVKVFSMDTKNDPAIFFGSFVSIYRKTNMNFSPGKKYQKNVRKTAKCDIKMVLVESNVCYSVMIHILC